MFPLNLQDETHIAHDFMAIVWPITVIFKAYLCFIKAKRECGQNFLELDLQSETLKPTFLMQTLWAVLTRKK